MIQSVESSRPCSRYCSTAFISPFSNRRRQEQQQEQHLINGNGDHSSTCHNNNNSEVVEAMNYFMNEKDSCSMMMMSPPQMSSSLRRKQGLRKLGAPSLKMSKLRGLKRRSRALLRGHSMALSGGNCYNSSYGASWDYDHHGGGGEADLGHSSSSSTSPSSNNNSGGSIADLRTLLATDVSTLRSLFGENKNKWWGDLDNETARKLYHFLLPRVLLRLVHETSGLSPDELAPLAFEARVAAKEYARERCNVPGRMFAMAFDGFRHLKKYGEWSSKGMSFDQVWDKYEKQVQEELMSSDPSLKAEDLTKQVCLKILERSCSTNPVVDKMFLKEDNSCINAEGEELLSIVRKFDQDINTIINDSIYQENLIQDILYQKFEEVRRKITVAWLRAMVRHRKGTESSSKKTSILSSFDQNSEVVALPPRQNNHKNREKVWESREWRTI